MRTTRTRTTKWSAIGATLGVLSGALAVVLATASPASAAPFSCDVSTIFVAQGNSSTQLNSLAYEDEEATFSAIGGAVTPPYNAIAFNPNDGFIYAVGSDDHLLRIHSDGSTDDLGVLGTVQDAGVTVNAGALRESDNTFWVLSSGGNEIFSIDLDSGTFDTTTYDLLQITGAADVTWIGGSLWGQRSGTDQLVRIIPEAPLANRLAFVPVPGLDPATGAGAAWTYGNGNLGLNDNVTGDLIQISITGGDGPTPVAAIVSVSAGPQNGNNDGTACVGSAEPDLSIEKTAAAGYQPGEPISWTIIVTNNGPGDSSGYIVNDTVPAAITDVASDTPGCVVAGNDVTCTGGALPAGESDEISITGTAPAPGGGTVSNTATLTPNEDDPAEDNNTSTFDSTEGVVNTICKATGLGLLNQRLAVANAPETPCALSSADIVDLTVGLGPSLPPLLAALTASVRATAILGLTSEGPGRAAAAAMVAKASINIPALGLSVIVEGVTTAATSQIVDCGAPAVLGSSSKILKLTLNGATPGGQAAKLSIPLIVGALHLNQQVIEGGTITRRAVFLDLPGTALDVMIAESKAGTSCPAP